MRTTYGANSPFGIQPIKPLRGFPDGRARIVIRQEDFVRVYVKTKTGIRGFYVRDVAGNWEPFVEFGVNERMQIEGVNQ